MPEAFRSSPHRAGLHAAALLVAAFSFVTSVQAQTASSSLDEGDDEARPSATVSDEIVVSAARDALPRRQVGSSVTVLERAEIEARRGATVADLLRTVPGVEVVRGGPPGAATSVFLRGTNSSHALVLIDGMRVNSPSVGSFDWADLTPENVERIEVLRGAQSALYGSEALGGVISIFTRGGGDGLHGDVSVEAGNEKQSRFATSWRGGGARWDWSLAAAGRRVDGLSAASEAAGNREEDPYETLNLSARFGTAFAGDGRADLSLRWLDSETALDGFGLAGPIDDPDYTQDRRAAVVSLHVEKPVTEGWTQHLRLGTARESLTARDPGSPFLDLDLDTVVTDVVLQSDVGVAAGQQLSIGYGYENRRADSASLDESVDVQSLFFEHRASFGDRLFLTAGARWDDHSVFGSETTWRGTASWLLGSGLRLHGSLGTGFKAPTFNELFFPGFGNPDLAAETSRSWDLGLEASFAGGLAVADLTWFDNDVDNLIGFDFVTFRAENIAAASIRGAEAQLTWSVAPGAELRASYTWTDSEDRATGEALPRRPRQRYTLSLLLDPQGPWDVSLSAVAVADRVDTGGAPLADYQRVDLTAGYDLGRRWSAYLRVENLFGDESAELAGYTTPGALGSVGLKYRL